MNPLAEHAGLIGELSTRLRKLKKVRSYWSAGKQREALDEVVDQHDDAVTVDVLVSEFAFDCNCPVHH